MSSTDNSYFIDCGYSYRYGGDGVAKKGGVIIGL